MVRIPAGVKHFSLHNVQTGSGAHPASCEWMPGSLSAGLKRAEREADNLPPCAEVKNGGAIPPLPRMSSWDSV
jgi:hypothetical protein